MNYAHTADGTAISLVDFPGLRGDPRAPAPLIYDPGDPGLQFYLPKAPNGTPLGPNAIPEWDVYNLVNDLSSPVRQRNYYQTIPVATYAFSGTLGQASGTVTETIDWIASQLSIDDLLLIKQSELDAHAEFVTYQSVRSTDNNNFWIDISRRQRERIGTINLVLTDRAKDRTLAEDSGVEPPTKKTVISYWARSPRLRLIRDSNGARLLAEVNEVAWGQAVKDIGLYDDAVENAYVACTNDFDTQHSGGNWDALAAIDVTSYAWPPYYTGPVAVSVRVV